MIAYFDMISGISGDMILGAMVDLGVPVSWLNEQFEKMPLPEADIRVENIQHNGIKAVNLFVDDKNRQQHHHKHNDDAQHNHNDDTHHHKHNDNAHHNKHNDDTHHHYEKKQYYKQNSHEISSKNYMQIKELISNSPFSHYVKSSALKAFEKIASAESEIHETPIENVHFHEVGGVDAIVDITGAFLCIEYLGITECYASVPSLGKGFAACSHGIIPIPAPATLKILKDVPIKSSGCDMELITPTGAAIITTLTDNFGNIPNMVLKNSGYGSGKRKSQNSIPNMLRVITGGSNKKSSDYDEFGNKFISPDISFINPNISIETVYIIKTSIDDMNPEIAGYLMERLCGNSALDVSYHPLFMKKNRPAFQLEVICKKSNLEELIEIILSESTSSGVRFYKTERAVLKRQIIKIDTPFGNIEAKEITDPLGKKRIVPEYEICRAIAKEKNIPIKDIYSMIL